MTMHLARGLTTLNLSKKKKKVKVTKGKLERWTEQCRKHNKEMKRLGLPDHMMSIDDYIDYIHGRHKSKTQPRAVQTPWHQTGNEFKRTTEHIPNGVSKHSFQPALKKEPLQYTGERKLVGIATMHKSNMVPIFADDDDKTGRNAATEIAKMRRN